MDDKSKFSKYGIFQIDWETETLGNLGVEAVKVDSCQ